MRSILLGVDLGTTTLSFLAADTRTQTVLETVTLNHGAFLPAAAPGFSEQDAGRIAQLTQQTLSALLDQYPDAAAIGLTGQMHGVVCVDKDGRAVSPFVTWQDARADAALCARILEATGRRIYPGYGCATLYADACAGRLPQAAQSFCSLMDYVAMHLTGASAPLMHESCADSLGLYDREAGRFDPEAFRALGLSLAPPAVTRENRIVGTFRGVPLSVAIGDNQASFLGSVRDEAHSVLVNYGTGSQISMAVDTPVSVPGAELRPYIGGRFLLCASALCGGRAYAMLERFFAAYAGAPAGTQYERINALAEKAYAGDARLSVCTQFCGTRSDPTLRGTVTGIGEENFTPAHLALGVVQGMVDELAQYYAAFPSSGVHEVVASGNAVRKNPMLRRLIADTFSLPVRLCISREEAALGTALFGGLCAGVLSREEAGGLIRYA